MLSKHKLYKEAASFDFGIYKYLKQPKRFEDFKEIRERLISNKEPVLPLSYSESRRGVARKPNLGYFFQ